MDISYPSGAAVSGETMNVECKSTGAVPTSRYTYSMYVGMRHWYDIFILHFTLLSVAFETPANSIDQWL